MFITTDSLRSPISALLAGSGKSYWTSAELALNHMWFVMSVVEIDRRDSEQWEIGRSMLLSRIEQAEHFITTHNTDDFRIKSLHIVTPSHINGTNGWVMEPLYSVWSAQEPDVTGQDVSVFETQSGLRYCDSIVETPVEDLIVGKLRFCLPKS